MITIQNGKLIIPDEDRFVGFAGDDSIREKQFVLRDSAEQDCAYTLCLRFDDDTVRTVTLSSEISGGDTVLSWNIRGEDICSAGVVQAQIKIADSDGSIGHTTKDFFLIGSAVELNDDGSEGEYVTPSMLEHSIEQAVQTLSSTAPYIDEDGYWCVYDAESGEYVRTDYHVSGITPDSAMSDVSDNAVSNRVIKRYADDKASACNAFAASYTDLKLGDVERLLATI